MDNKMTKWNFLEPFLFTREPLHLLDISRKLNENHTTVRKYLNNFAKEGLLQITSKGRLTLYKINPNFPLIIDYLSIVEKEYLIKKTNEDNIFKELIKDIQQISKKPIIIFGSCVNNFSKAKDIDIICLEDLKDLKKKLNKELHIIKINSLKNLDQTLKKEIIKKHIIVYGVEEVVKWLI
jgi:predicted DNA-binding transcriptional regulator